MATHRWLSAASTTDADPRQAGERAAREALTGPDPRLLLVFCAEARDPAAVLSGINAVSGGVPLIGCSATAVIAPEGPSQSSVVVVALGGPGFSVATGVGRSAATRPRHVGAEVAASATAVQERPHQVFVLLIDGLVTRHEEVLAGVYSVVGASMPLIGGLSSPADQAVRQTFHLYGDEVVGDAVVGAVIASDAPLGVGIRHGWRKVGEPMIVTRAVHGDVHTLNDQPALSAYLNGLDAPEEAYVDPAAFATFSRTRPIGVRRRNGEEVRNVSSTECFAEGWLRCAGEIPEGGLVWLMEGDEASVLAAAGEACADAVAGLGGQPPLGLLAFDCEGRRGVLGADGMRLEVGRMKDEARDAPVAGFYTWGEVGRVRGINGYHNQTLAVLAVG
jgi:hypothetical protein